TTRLVDGGAGFDLADPFAGLKRVCHGGGPFCGALQYIRFSGATRIRANRIRRFVSGQSGPRAHVWRGAYPYFRKVATESGAKRRSPARPGANPARAAPPGGLFVAELRLP